MNPLLTVVVASLAALCAATAQVISDPVADFLALPIEDRYSDASVIARVDKVSIDIDLDGQPELLVGHHKMWLGDNQGVYFAIYKKLASGEYQRLTQPSQDIGMVLRDGLPQFVFVGRVDELGDTGILICNPPQGDGALKSQRIESRLFVSIDGDSIKVRELPGLDLTRSADNGLYQKYFGHEGKQGGFVSKSITAESLTQLGYVLPDWTKQPPLLTKPAIDPSISSIPTVESSAEPQASTPIKPFVQTAEKKVSTGEFDEPSASSWLASSAIIAAVIGLLWLALRKRK